MRRTSTALARSLFGAALVLTLGCAGVPVASPAGVPARPTPSPAPPIAPPTGTPDSPTTPAARPSEFAPPTEPVVPTPAAATPAGGSGGPPERLLEAGHTEPSLVVDAAGHAHVAAVRAGGIVYASNADGTWTTVEASSPTGGDDSAPIDRQPSLAVDVDGSLALVFSRWSSEDTFGRLPEGVLIARGDAGAWSEPAMLVDDPSGGHSPSLALRAGTVHLAYVLGIAVDVITAEQRFPVRYLTDADGSPQDVEVSPNGTAPVLALEADGAVHVLFGDENGLLDRDGLWHARAAPGGPFDVEPIPGTTRYAAPHDLSVDPSGAAHAAWTRPGFTTADDRYSALYQRRTDAWAGPETIALDATVRAIAADADGHVHLVGSDLEGAWYATNRGGSFETTRLAAEPEVGADVAVDAFGRAHVVLATGEGEESQLWYWIGDQP